MDEQVEDPFYLERKAAACTGKEAFETHAAAKRVADRPRVRNPMKLEIYRCDFCGDYHLTAAHSKKKKRKNGSRKKRPIRL